MDEVSKRLRALAPADADPGEVARRDRPRLSDLPKGQRPFRVHIDPANDGAETVTTSVIWSASTSTTASGSTTSSPPPSAADRAMTGDIRAANRANRGQRW